MEDIDSDTEDTPQLPQNVNEKRRAQNVIFRSFILQAAEKEVKKQKEDDKDAADEEMSIRDLMAKQEATPIITDPREYQIELFERAKTQNTIAVLDTGSGKTLIAVLLLRHVIDQELEDRRSGKSPRISFFLVPSVTLVFQQFAVLECNLDHKVDRFCGAMGCDLWTKEVWEKHFVANKVLVCTAEVLLQCLMHSFINIKQINLLIFDEAHHAKKNHAYAKIIQDYYLAEPDKALRPKIFGTTASPVDAKVDVAQAARYLMQIPVNSIFFRRNFGNFSEYANLHSELETLLHSQIATTSDLSLLQKVIKRPAESVLRYSPSLNMTDSPLSSRISTKYGEIGMLQPMVRRAAEVTSHLGSWAGDFYWSLALPEEKAKKTEGRFERSLRNGSMTARDEGLALLQEANEAVRAHTFRKPEVDTSGRLSSCEVSPKVAELHLYLKEYFERPSNHRCIVFVEQRNTARLLEKIMSFTGGPHLRTGVLIGSGSDRVDAMQASFRDQVMTVIKFRKGELNCLFATSVAEEGLDIPDCNLIIRFDPVKTMIQYVQSRGRARHKHSKMVHMLQAGNYVQDRSLQDIRFCELYMRKFCEALPADRLLMGNNDATDIYGNEGKERTYVVKTTGAKITYGSSLTILAHFCSCLPTETENTTLQPTYIMSSRAGKFICEVILPDQSPIAAVIGDICSRKMLAKQSSAFKACVQLREAGYLDHNLLPVYKKRLPAMRNAALALNMKSSGQYAMRLKPTIWEEGRGSLPTKLYPLIIDVPEGLERPHSPLVLLSRTPIPDLPEFPIFLTEGGKRMVRLQSSGCPIALAENHVELLTSFTLCIFKDLFNKTFERSPEKMSYWLAPAVIDADGQLNGAEFVDWTLLETIHAEPESKWRPEMPSSFLLDKFLVDPWSGGRRWYTKRIADEYTPSSAVPEGTVRGPSHCDSILQYSGGNIYRSSRVKFTFALDQPVLECEQIQHRLNLLAEPNPKELNMRSLAFVCPEPLRISSLPPAIVTTAYVFPAIIHRIDSYLIAVEICQKLGIEVNFALALEALTKDSDNSDNHQNPERINLQRGMGNNYERLEFLGDCFLKMATSVSTFNQNPNDNEFEFHVKRMLLLCNQNLFNVANKLSISEYIRSQAFSRRTWYPEGVRLLEGKGSKKAGTEVIKHRLGDKTIADVCEALMGAAFLTHDKPGNWRPEHWQNAIKAVTIFVGSPDHTMLQWSDYLNSYEKPAYQTTAASASQLDLAEKLTLEHPYSFKYPRLAASAFMHPSYPQTWGQLPSYQRLEFLGDSLLDLVCVTDLFYRFPDKDPQWLTEHKMAMVSNKFLGAVSVKLGFHRHLRYNSSIMEHQIREYATELLEAEQASQGVQDYWTTVKDPPKCLPDIVEAYVGAVFIDSDFNYNEVQRFYDMHIKHFFENMSIYDTFANNHPIARLHNMLKENFGCQEYRLMADENPTGDSSPPLVIAGLMVHETIVAFARGKSARYVKIRAANNASDELDGLTAVEFRTKYGCGCSQKVDNQGSGAERTAEAICNTAT